MRRIDIVKKASEGPLNIQKINGPGKSPKRILYSSLKGPGKVLRGSEVPDALLHIGTSPGNIPQKLVPTFACSSTGQSSYQREKGVLRNEHF